MIAEKVIITLITLLKIVIIIPAQAILRLGKIFSGWGK